MLNTLTRQRRLALRRYRASMLALMTVAFLGGALLCITGLWQHEIVLALTGLVGLSAGLRARVRYLGVRRALRLLGA